MSNNYSQIPKVVGDLIDRYQNLHINGTTVCTPYFRNVKHERAGLRALLGKGTPSEIEQEVLIYAKLRNFDLTAGHSPQVIRDFMQKQGIGVDCSGYVNHLLNRWLKEEHHHTLYSQLHYPPMAPWRQLIRWFRPAENTSADTLTNQENTLPVKLTDVQPGDLMRLKGIDSGHHVALIIHVAPNKQGLPSKITYTHSTNNYGGENGVRVADIVVTNPNGELSTQDWRERDAQDHCWTLDQLLKDYEDNGLRRPKFFTHTHA